MTSLKQKHFQHINFERSLDTSVPIFVNLLRREYVACQEYGEHLRGKLRVHNTTKHNKEESGKSNGEHRKRKISYRLHGNEYVTQTGGVNPLVMMTQWNPGYSFALRTKRRALNISSGILESVWMKRRRSFSNNSLSNDAGNKTLSARPKLHQSPKKRITWSHSQHNLRVEYSRPFART